MDETTTVYDTDNKEPATSHDVTEGGVIGLAGGAVVGALAGGPVGAVVGAVVGGAASAGATDYVDKRDNDFVETVEDHPGTKIEGTDEEVVATPVYTTTTVD